MEFDPGPTPASIDWYTDRGDTPQIVSISDIHGYLDDARDALLAVGKTAEYHPVVTADSDGTLHWADNDYILLFNGDLIDRGPHNEDCIRLVERLAAEAPPGRVRYHLGNHEMAVLFPDRFPWPGVFSIELDRETRRSFIEHVAAGRIPAAFEGYRYTYSHAGSQEEFDVARVNDQATAAAADLLSMVDAGQFDDNQREVISEYETVFGIGEGGGRGPSAGLLWMDFAHMPPGAPPQIVGHSRQPQPSRSGRVICENVIRSNRQSPGGEAVLIEADGRIEAVINESTGVTVRTL